MIPEQELNADYEANLRKICDEFADSLFSRLKNRQDGKVLSDMSRLCSLLRLKMQIALIPDEIIEDLR